MVEAGGSNTNPSVMSKKTKKLNFNINTVIHK